MAFTKAASAPKAGIGSRQALASAQLGCMKTCFVAGCGFVGLATARLLHERGWNVIGGTHSEESAMALAGEAFPVVACDITNRSHLERLPPLDAVLHCASSGRGGVEQYRSVYLEGSRALIDILSPSTFVFASSTSVYAQTDGSVVTEGSAAEPDRETGRILRETEDFVLAHGGCVARLAGIYGPARSVLLKKFFSGEAVIEGDGGRFVNQVHRDDIASAFVLFMESQSRGIFNVCDSEPMTQRSVYEWLAGRFEKPLPPSGPIDPNRKRGWTSKRVSNAKLRALGWAPRFPSFRDAVKNDPTLLTPLTL